MSDPVNEPDKARIALRAKEDVYTLSQLDFTKAEDYAGAVALLEAAMHWGRAAVITALGPYFKSYDSLVGNVNNLRQAITLYQERDRRQMQKEPHDFVKSANPEYCERCGFYEGHPIHLGKRRKTTEARKL